MFALFLGIGDSRVWQCVSPRDWSRFGIIRLIDNEIPLPSLSAMIVFTRSPGLISANVAAECMFVEIMGAGEDKPSAVAGQRTLVVRVLRRRRVKFF